MKYKQIKQKKGEAEAMVKAGYPICFWKSDSKISRHCNTCIKRFREVV